MPGTLFLLRHAKSSWDDPYLEDRERPLNKRGQKDAPRMAKALKTRGYIPDLILCSSAVRTRQTLGLMKKALGGVPVRFEDGLYEVGAEDLFARCKELDDSSRAVMLIGHNPGLEDLLEILVQPADEDRLPGKFPTCAVAVLSCPTDRWSHLTSASAQLTDFVRPKELKAKPGAADRQ